MNRVLLLGNLGRDPVMRYTAAGKPVVDFTMATTETWVDREGQRKESTEWHNVSMLARSAEAVGQYCRKGHKVLVEGKLATRKWKDRNGEDRYTTEVQAQHIHFLTQSTDGGHSGPSDFNPHSNQYGSEGGGGEYGGPY